MVILISVIIMSVYPKVILAVVRKVLKGLRDLKGNVVLQVEQDQRGIVAVPMHRDQPDLQDLQDLQDHAGLQVLQDKLGQKEYKDHEEYKDR